MPTFSLPFRPPDLTIRLQPNMERSSTAIRQRRTTRSFGNKLSSVNFRRKNTRPVSCYALFKGWLLLSQPPGCFSGLTSFPT
jgi:hypothetical protein